MLSSPLRERQSTAEFVRSDTQNEAIVESQVEKLSLGIHLTCKTGY